MTSFAVSSRRALRLGVALLWLAAAAFACTPDVATETISSPFANTPAYPALDPTFGGGTGVVTQSGVVGGDYDAGNAVEFDSLGNIYVAGTSYDTVGGGGHNHAVIYRFDSSGNLDPAFGSGGKYITSDTAGSPFNDNASGIAVDSLDRPVIVGFSTDPSQTPPTYNDFVAVWRFTTSGALDPSFGAGGVFLKNDSTVLGANGDYGYGVAVDSSDNVAAGGNSRSGSGIDMALWVLDSAGNLDTGFNGTGIQTDTGCCQNGGGQPLFLAGGDIVLAGYVGDSYSAIWQYTSTGAQSGTRVDIRAGASGGDADGYADTAENSAGHLIAAGFSSQSGIGYMMLRAFTLSPPVLDGAFASGGQVFAGDIVTGQTWAQAQSVVIDSSDRIIVTGFVTDGAGDTYLAVWRFTSGGTPDTTFGSGAGAVAYKNLVGTFSPSNDRGYSIRIDSSGRYVVTGYGADTNGDLRLIVLRINP